MPKRKTRTRARTHDALRNVSYESQVITWLMQDGWQVFRPVLDNGHKTDILISDGPNFHRIQVKTVKALDDDLFISNGWKGSDVDVVIVFARNSTWGYVMKAFSEDKRKLNAKGHQKFEKHTGKDFLAAFHKV